jgi:hypothetical protein
MAAKAVAAQVVNERLAEPDGQLLEKITTLSLDTNVSKTVGNTGR